MRKILIIVAATLVGVVLLATIAIYWFFSGDGMRLALEQQATARLGQPVRIQAARGQIFPRPGIGLTGVEVGEPVRLTLASVDVSTDLRALLSRRIEDARIVISDSTIQMPLPFALPEEDAPSEGAAGSGGASAFAEATADRRSLGGGWLDPPSRAGEVVLIMGLPAAGKSTIAHAFVDRGYARLNRDDAGGSLRQLLPHLERLVAAGSSRIVLDNTYVSRASRALVVQAAAGLGLPVRCVWLSTSVEAAQVNAAWRMVSKYGCLLGPDEMRKAVKGDISAFPPRVQFRHQRELEPPDPSEGFSRIETIAFERTHDTSMTNKAVIVWCDEVLIRRGSDGDRSPLSAEDIGVIAERSAVLRRYQADGWRLLGLSWRPEIAEQMLTSERADASFARMQELLGVSIEVLYCPHGAGPPVCWCRKPRPGLGVVFIQRHRLDPSQCIYVGAGPQDPGFARRLGFQYRDAQDFFAGP